MERKNPREIGHLTYDALKKRVDMPSKERLEKGPVAIIECTEDIPCNPCIDACPFEAISKESLTTPPEVSYEKCTGCGECISVCPGLAIFVVNMNYKEGKALVSIPYEFLPVPEKGRKVNALDRSGKRIGEAEVTYVRRGKRKTNIVSVAVDKDLAMEARAVST